jgi:hypothetical protein
MAFVALVGWATVPPASAYADSGPVIVIPSRPGVPVIINGQDASYAVVEGDWGLARPGAVPVTVIGGSPILPNPVYSPRNSYHPRYGRAPQRGRVEIEPPPDRELPEPAENFSREWSTSSDPFPVAEPAFPPQYGESQSGPGDPGSMGAPNMDRNRFHRRLPPHIIHRRRDHHR